VDVLSHWRGVHEELHNLSHLPNNNWEVKSCGVTRAGHQWSIGQTTNAYLVLVGKVRRKRYRSIIRGAAVQARKEMTHTPTFTTVPLPNKTAPKAQSSLAGCIQTNRHWRQKNSLFWLARCISFSRWTDPAGTYKMSGTRLGCWQPIIVACHP